MVRWRLIGGVLCALACCVAGQQSEARADDAATPAAVDAPKDAGAALAVAEFESKFGDFKQVLARLRSLQNRYQLASRGERKQIEADFSQAVADGKVMVPGLVTAAEAAFKADPKYDAAADFLAANLADAVHADRYEDALRIAKALRAGNYQSKGFAGLAGLAEFYTNDFVQAQEDLIHAAGEKALDDQGNAKLKSVGSCIELWKEEQRLRAAEEAADDLPRVKLTTSQGDIVVELFENEAPNTTANFISLVGKHFYDGLTFHRVLQGFMAQGGDPKGNGSGGPGYTIACECFTPNHRNHFAGSLSMAHTAERDTGGSQFFLTFGPTPDLNGKHTVFGRVIEGMDVLAKLQKIDPQHPGSAKPDKIIQAVVLRKRNHPYEPVTGPPLPSDGE